MTIKKDFKPLILIAVISLIWGSSFILMKIGLETFEPLQMAALRLTFAGIVMAPIAWKFRREVSRHEIGLFLLIGITGNGATAFLFAKSETVISSASAGILNTLTPIFILLTGVLFFKMTFTWKQILGITVGIAGAFFIILSGEEEVDLFTHFGYSMMVVLATISYSTNTNLIKYFFNQKSPLLVSSYALVLIGLPASVYLFGFSDFLTLLDENLRGHITDTQSDIFGFLPVFWKSFGAIAILGILGTALAVVLYMRLLQLTDAVVAGSLAYLLPVVALFWSFLAGETLGWPHFGGMALIFLGLFISRKG